MRFFFCCSSVDEKHKKKYPYNDNLADIIFRDKDYLAESIIQASAGKIAPDSIDKLILMHALKIENSIVRIQSENNEPELYSFTQEYLKYLLRQPVRDIKPIFENCSDNSSPLITLSLQEMICELENCTDKVKLNNNAEFIATVLVRESGGLNAFMSKGPVFKPRGVSFIGSDVMTSSFPPALRVSYIPNFAESMSENNSCWSLIPVGVKNVARQTEGDKTHFNLFEIAVDQETQTENQVSYWNWHDVIRSLGLEKYESKKITDGKAAIAFCKKLYIELDGNTSRATEIFDEKKSCLEILHVLVERANKRKGGASEKILEIIEQLDTCNPMKQAFLMVKKELDERKTEQSERRQSLSSQLSGSMGGGEPAGEDGSLTNGMVFRSVFQAR